MNYKQSKENRPLFAALGQGGALIPLFRLPRHRGGWRATRRMAWISPDRPKSAWLPDEPGSPGPGREASRPAPCGAPTRHLGLYAFDRGRTGPAPSGRRGCPSTARGRGCVLHRPQVPLPFPARKTPHENAPRRVDRDSSSIITLRVKSSSISPKDEIFLPANMEPERLGVAAAAPIDTSPTHLWPSPAPAVPNAVPAAPLSDHSVARTSASAVLRHQIIAARKKLASSWN